MWDKIKRWFWYSESIAWARVKLFVGTAFTAIQQSGVDLTSFFDSQRVKIAIQIAFAWLIVDGTVSEWARRRRTTAAPDGTLKGRDQ